MRPLWALAAGVLAATVDLQPTAASELRVGVVGRFAGFNPDVIADGPTQPASGFVIRPLLHFDGHINLACLVCENLPTRANGGVTDDTDPEGRPGQRVRFRIRHEARWDDGAPVVAEDFVLAWRAGRDAANRYAWRSRLSEEIWDARAVSEREFEVRRRGRSCAPADFRFAPLPSRLVQAGGQDPGSLVRATGASGDQIRRGFYTGPYRPASVSREADGDRVVLERNPFWRGPRPAYDTVVVVYRMTPDALRKAVLEGHVDLVSPASPALALEAQAAHPDRLNAVVRPGRSLLQVSVNLDNPVLKDIRVRRALLLSLDRAALAASISPGAAPAQSFLSARFPHFEALLAPSSPTLEQAQALLEQAGWTQAADGVRRSAGGAPLRLRLAVQPSRLNTPVVDQIVQSWRALGVEAVVEPWTGIAQHTGEQPPPLALFGYTLEGGANIDHDVFDSASIPRRGEVRNGLNIFRWRNAEVDRLVALLREECEPAARAAALRALQRRVADELPMLPLVFLPEAHILPAALAPPDASRVELVSSREVERWTVRSP